jgi:hypothetical protein
MSELPAHAHPPISYQRGVVNKQTVIAKNLLAVCIELVNEWHAAAVCELPLLLRSVDEPSIVIEVPKPLFKPGLRCAP